VKADPDGFRKVWISFFLALGSAFTLGVAPNSISNNKVLVGIVFVAAPALILGSLAHYARRVQRRLDQERKDP